MAEHRDEKGRLAAAQSAIAKRLRKQSGESTPRTKKYRIAVRGEDRAASLAHEAATDIALGRPVSDKHKQKLVRTPLGKHLIKKSRAYHAPEAWDRRRLASKPGAQFDEKGRLSNYEEMKRRYSND